MKIVIATAIVAAAVGGVLGYGTWSESIGGLSRFGTTVISAAFTGVFFGCMSALALGLTKLLGR